MPRSAAFSCLCCLWLFGGTAAHPETPSGGFAQIGQVTLHGDQADVFSVGVGAYDFADRGTAAAATAEYRLGRKLWFVGPSIGLMANSDGGVLGYLTVYIDLSWSQIHLTPQVGIAGYREGDSRDLGSVFQFRASGDLAYEFANAGRLGLRLVHVSNANTTNPNPGEEELYLVYSLPLGPLL
jgi:lipid A 3-O-deacylase